MVQGGPEAVLVEPRQPGPHGKLALDHPARDAIRWESRSGERALGPGWVLETVAGTRPGVQQADLLVRPCGQRGPQRGEGHPKARNRAYPLRRCGGQCSRRPGPTWPQQDARGRKADQGRTALRCPCDARNPFLNGALMCGVGRGEFMEVWGPKPSALETSENPFCGGVRKFFGSTRHELEVLTFRLPIMYCCAFKKCDWLFPIGGSHET
jgi:hypothetical protein